MAQVNLRLYTLVSQTAAGTTQVYDLDFMNYPAEQTRSFIVQKVASDVIDIEVAFNRDTGPWANAANVSSAVTSAAFVVAGSWAFLRVVKTGTNGLAIVQGVI